jgi:hypothetical protein
MISQNRAIERFWNAFDNSKLLACFQIQPKGNSKVEKRNVGHNGGMDNEPFV